MKRYVSFIILIGVLLTCLFSCGPDSGNKDTGVYSDETVYEMLDRMVREGHSSLTVRVRTEEGSDALESEYRIEATSSGERISYSVQQFSEFTSSNGELVLPDERITTLRGEATVSGGKVTSQSGDRVDVDLANVGLPDISFNENYFSNISESDGRFFADVTSPSAFLGSNNGLEGMTVEVLYTESGISKLVLTFVKDGRLNNCEYIFA